MQIKLQWDITSRVLEWASSKREEVSSAAENVEKREPVSMVGGSANCITTLETSMEFPQEIRNRTVWCSNSASGNILNKMETPCQRVIYTPLFVAVLFTTASYEKNLNVHQKMNK